MVKNIFVVRHGEAIHQVNPASWHNYTDSNMPLSVLGQKQARECGLAFKSLVTADNTAIISSPYERASKTAETIKEINNFPEIIYSDDLKEQNFGLFTGLSTEECWAKYPEYAKIFDIQEKRVGRFSVVPPYGESRMNVVERVEDFFDDIIPLMDKEEVNNVIIVSHSIVSKAIAMRLLENGPKWFDSQIDMQNCAVRKLAYEQGNWVDKGYVFSPASKSKNLSIAPVIVKKGKQND